ncbi:MAG TPA: ABC transporter substrate-binding protein [Candidatus Binatia bacterium]|nr:ABC transporter substrate-binding protein [Candidatus Binatia bacterium]
MKRSPAVFAIIAMVFTTSPAAAQSQATRIGILGPGEEPRFSEVADGLKQGLREHGYSPQSLEILEGRVARGDRGGARDAAEKMVRQDAKVLFVIGSELAKTARQVSSETPVVFITPGDPVAAGLVSSLAHPGGNMTAMTFEYPELAGKRLELLKEMLPKLRRVIVLYDPRDASPKQSAMAARESAPQLGITLVERETRRREDITTALDKLEGDALLAIPGGLTTSYYAEMIRAANSKRVATMFHARSRSTMEAFATYGANDADIARQAARLVAKILKGSKAGELPIERPSKLEFTVNLKTAKVIGATIPPNVLARADKVMK